LQVSPESCLLSLLLELVGYFLRIFIWDRHEFWILQWSLPV
jgi:hypothetical protein